MRGVPVDGDDLETLAPRGDSLREHPSVHRKASFGLRQRIFVVACTALALGLVVGIAIGRQTAPSPRRDASSSPHTPLLSVSVTRETGTQPDRTIRVCTTDRLVVGRGHLSIGNGRTFLPISLLNTALDSCTLQGWPQVDFVDAKGSAISTAAHLGNEAPLATLGAGQRAWMTLGYRDTATAADCAVHPIAITAVRVYLPGQVTAIALPVKLRLCASSTVATAIGAPL
ncbi:MAG: hypothetical protein QOJ71_3244 [Actinomycetota bacterium]|jgi:hypothetical protein|nr:hypothetical protein [Actinomycetota bacterium]